MVVLGQAVVVQAEDDVFRAVFIDSESEAKLGPFPFDRGVLARGVEAIRKAKPRGLIIKLFLDMPRSASGDAALAEAMKGMKVLLQARMDDSQTQANPLPEKFFVPQLKVSTYAGISGKSGWLPLPMFASAAADVGFVDVVGSDVCPVLECYQGRYVRSLPLAAVEFALGARAEIMPGKRLKLNGVDVALDEFNQYPVTYPDKDALKYLPFHRLLLAADADLKTLEDRVVILGYDGDKIDRMDTPLGKMESHRVFYYGLISLYDRVAKKAETRR